MLYGFVSDVSIECRAALIYGSLRCGSAAGEWHDLSGFNRPGSHGVRICQKFETLRPRCFSKMLATPCSDGRLDHCIHDEYSGLKVKPFAHPAFFPRS